MDSLTACEQLLFDTYLRPGMAILDLGVGGGRTTPYLSAIASRYVGVDYSEEMIRACRSKFPHLRFNVADASDLSQFADASFDSVVFSFNGLDCLAPHEKRENCLRECHRVLKAGGVYIFSSHNPRSLFLDWQWDRDRLRRLANKVAGGWRSFIPSDPCSIDVRKSGALNCEVICEGHPTRSPKTANRSFLAGGGLHCRPVIWRHADVLRDSGLRGCRTNPRRLQTSAGTAGRLPREGLRVQYSLVLLCVLEGLNDATATEPGRCPTLQHKSASPIVCVLGDQSRVPLWIQGGQRFATAGEARWLRTVAVAGADLIFLQTVPDKFHANRAPSGVGIGFGIIAERVEMIEVIADRSKGLVLISPVLGEICFATGGGSHTVKDRRRNGLEPGFLCADHVDRDPGRLGEFGYILGRHNAGVVGAIGKHDDDLPAAVLGGIFQSQQESVVEGSLIAGHGSAYGLQ
jgi:SAM-dependent methyltransferase